MKNYVVILMLIFSSVAFSQTIDWENAPLNPAAVYYTKNHYNLKGPVKEVRYEDLSGKTQHYWFNKKGLLTKKVTSSVGGTFRRVFFYDYNKNNQLVTIKSGSSKDNTDTAFKYDPKVQEFTYNTNGQIVSGKYTSGGKIAKYTYKNGLLVGIENGFDLFRKNYLFEYDAKGRLIKEILPRKEGNYVKTLAYSKLNNGGQNITVNFYNKGEKANVSIYNPSGFYRHKYIQIVHNPKTLKFTPKGYIAYNPKFINQKIDQYGNVFSEYSYLRKAPYVDIKIKYYGGIKSEVQKPKLANKGCISGNCVNGYGTYTYAGNIKATGFFVNGTLNGYGEVLFSNGDSYVGNLKNGARLGYGIYKTKSKNQKYYGYWKNNKKDGYGYITINNETKYAGIYKEDKQIKNLFLDYANGKVSNGCIGDCQNGFGSLTYSNNDIYYGFFKNGIPYRTGTYSWVNGNTFTGIFDVNGKLNKFGLFSTDAYIYIGELTSGRLTGKAVKIDKKTKKTIYGEFENGKLINDYSNPNFKPTKINTKKNTNDVITINAQKFYNAYKQGADVYIPYLKNLKESEENKKLSIDALIDKYGKIANAVYYIDKEASYEFLMNCKLKGKNLSATLNKVNKEFRTFVRAKARKELQKYSNKRY